VAITEAPIDALTLHLAGLPAIALLGTGNRPPWLIRHLAKQAPHTPPGYSRTVYLALDNDKGGHKAAAEIGAALQLVQARRLCPTRKDWNEDLTAGGLDALMDTLAAAGVYDSILPPDTASESQPGAFYGYSSEPADQAETTTAEPGAEPSQDGEDTGPAAYESCEPGHTDSRPTEDTASESHSSALFSESEAPEPQFRKQIDTFEAVDPAEVAALAAEVRAALAGRSLPIPLSPGETIIGVDLYAAAEARSAASPSPAVSRPALDRLAALGIPLPTWP